MREATLEEDAEAGRDRLHLVVALFLAALLLLLPILFGIGPGSWRSCAAAPAAASATSTLPVPGPAVEPATPTGPVAGATPVAEAPAAPAVITEEPPPAARVYFRVDHYGLPADVEFALADVITYLKRNPRARVELKGFHDPRGDAAHNRKLASDRATSVADYLIAAGVSADRVRIAEPAGTSGSGTLAEARRVEVSVIR